MPSKYTAPLSYSVGQQHSWQALSAFSLVKALVGGTKTNVYKKVSNGKEPMHVICISEVLTDNFILKTRGPMVL